MKGERETVGDYKAVADPGQAENDEHLFSQAAQPPGFIPPPLSTESYSAALLDSPCPRCVGPTKLEAKTCIFSPRERYAMSCSIPSRMCSRRPLHRFSAFTYSLLRHSPMGSRRRLRSTAKPDDATGDELQSSFEGCDVGSLPLSTTNDHGRHPAWQISPAGCERRVSINKVNIQSFCFDRLLA
jgi:hypothetical protein